MASLMLVNPRKRRKARKTTVAKRNPSRRRKSLSTLAHHKKHSRRRSYRRNPIGGTSVTDQVKGAAVGALGAVGVDLLMTRLPIPATMKTGAMLHLSQGLVSLGLGMAVAKFGRNKKLGAQLADGGLTVALYAATKSMIGPKLGLSGFETLGDDLLGYEMLGDDLLGDDDYLDGVGVTEDDWSQMNGVGWYDAAPVSEY